MKFSESSAGRVFIIRLEDGDILHESIERFAREKNISAASLIALGGADSGSVLVTGPEEGRSDPIVPVETVLREVYEITGTGTIFPDSAGNPSLHMHISCGRSGSVITGCVRRGVKVWHVMEIILTEMTESSARRVVDPLTGFELLIP
jgi:predicted DNA-binding protein with PD1-like motif